MTKILFLDIDGVFTSFRTVAGFGRAPSPHSAQPRILFDEVAVRIVGNIVQAAGAQVVLSSSWRRLDDWHSIGPVLGLPIIDRTPALCGPRGAEIAAWLSAHPEVTTFAILDDDGDMLAEHLPYFVKTTFEDGLTWANTLSLCQVLGVDVLELSASHRYPTPTQALDWSAA